MYELADHDVGACLSGGSNPEYTKDLLSKPQREFLTQTT